MKSNTPGRRKRNKYYPKSPELNPKPMSKKATKSIFALMLMSEIFKLTNTRR